MAELTLPPPGTLEVIDRTQVTSHEHFDSVGISMSELGTDCDRSLWYTLRWASEPEQMSGGKLDRFETGNIWERRLLDHLRRIPDATVWAEDPETGRQFKVYALGGHVRGKLDGEVAGLPEDPFTIHCVEIKSHKESSFNDLKKRGVKKSKPAHWWQCQMYMHARKREVCLYFAVNKNNECQKYTEFVRYDGSAVNQMEQRLERVIASARAPARISDNPKAFACMFCHHKGVCRLETFGRVHCRTCIHSTAVIDSSTDAIWRCEKYQKTLTLDEQRAGCPSHLYHPAFVPGEQVGAGDNWVSYILSDGSEWEDQKSE